MMKSKSGLIIVFGKKFQMIPHNKQRNMRPDSLMAHKNTKRYLENKLRNKETN